MKRMRKFIPTLFVALLLSGFLSFSALAFSEDTPAAEPGQGSEEEQLISEQADLLGTQHILDHVPEQARAYVADIDSETIDAAGLADTLNPAALFQALGDQIKKQFTAPLRVLGLLMGIILLSAVMESFAESSGGQFQSVFTGVAMIASIACVFTSLKDGISYLITTIEDVVLFMQSFVPIMASAVAASGYPASAGAFSGILFILCEVVSSIAGVFFLPIICVHLALTVASGVNQELEQTGITKTIKNFVTYGLGLLSTVFVGIMTLRSGITALPDSVLKKTFKFAAGKFVPIVGSTLGEATDMVLTSAATLKAGIGTIGVIVIFFSFFGPVIHALLWAASVKCAQIAAGIAGQRTLAKFFEGVGATFTMMVALLFFSGLAFLVCVSVMIQVGGI